MSDQFLFPFVLLFLVELVGVRVFSHGLDDLDFINLALLGFVRNYVRLINIIHILGHYSLNILLDLALFEQLFVRNQLLVVRRALLCASTSLVELQKSAAGRNLRCGIRLEVIQIEVESRFRGQDGILDGFTSFGAV